MGEAGPSTEMVVDSLASSLPASAPTVFPLRMDLEHKALQGQEILEDVQAWNNLLLQSQTGRLPQFESLARSETTAAREPNRMVGTSIVNPRMSGGPSFPPLMENPVFQPFSASLRPFFNSQPPHNGSFLFNTPAFGSCRTPILPQAPFLGESPQIRSTKEGYSAGNLQTNMYSAPGVSQEQGKYSTSKQASMYSALVCSVWRALVIKTIWPKCRNEAAFSKALLSALVLRGFLRLLSAVPCFQCRRIIRNALEE